MKNILFVLNKFPNIGGIETVTTQLANRLSEKYNISILSTEASLDRQPGLKNDIAITVIPENTFALEKNDLFNQYLSDFELEHTKNLAKTSMGQKKKYLVSFALATNTPLLLMDEPTNGMDIPSKSQFRKVIASGMNEQKSIVISTHQVRDLENMIDHITILDNGLLLLDADTHTISSRLRFIKGGNESEIAGAFYKVSTIAGYSAILPNETDEESLIDIEMLFNCTIGDPEVIHNIFNSSAK